MTEVSPTGSGSLIDPAGPNVLRFVERFA